MRCRSSQLHGQVLEDSSPARRLRDTNRAGRLGRHPAAAKFGAHHASWSRPSMHPFCKALKGIVNVKMWRPRLPSPGSGGRSKSVVSAPAVAHATPATLNEYVASSPAVTCAAPAPVIESVASSPAVPHATPKFVGKGWPPGIARYSVF